MPKLHVVQGMSRRVAATKQIRKELADRHQRDSSGDMPYCIRFRVSSRRNAYFYIGEDPGGEMWATFDVYDTVLSGIPEGIAEINYILDAGHEWDEVGFMSALTFASIEHPALPFVRTHVRLDGTNPERTADLIMLIAIRIDTYAGR